jgi:hypothetical protein
MSDLRTRIAAIVTQMDNHPCCGSSIHAVEPSDWSLNVADAVIAELKPELNPRKPTFNNEILSP